MRQILLLRPNPEMSWSKKFRDRKRYFAKLRQRAMQYDLEVEPGSWWSFFHEHLDWNGRGDLKWRYRRETVRAHALLYERFAVQLATYPSDFQLWISLSSWAANNDAVYVHTRDPSGDMPFPVDFSEVRWGAETTPHTLREVLPDDFLWGVTRDDVYLAFRPGVGLDLRSDRGSAV